MHVIRTDAQHEEVQKQESRQHLLHSVVEGLKAEHSRIWKEAGEAKDKIGNAENENRNLRQQLSTAEKELQKTVADRDSLAAELGTPLPVASDPCASVPAEMHPCHVIVPTESVRSELQTTKGHLETAKASCADLSGQNEKVTSDNLQLTTRVELQAQQLSEHQKRTHSALRTLIDSCAHTHLIVAGWLDLAVLDEKTADFHTKCQEAEVGAAKVKELETALAAANSELAGMKETNKQISDELTGANKELAARLDEIVSLVVSASGYHQSIRLLALILDTPLQEQLKASVEQCKSIHEADNSRINQMQTMETELKSQLETVQTAQAGSQDELTKLTADIAGLQQQLTDKQTCFDQLTSDKQSLETDSSQKLSAQQSELEQLISDKQFSAQAMTLKDAEMASLATRFRTPFVQSSCHMSTIPSLRLFCCTG